MYFWRQRFLRHSAQSDRRRKSQCQQDCVEIFQAQVWGHQSSSKDHINLSARPSGTFSKRIAPAERPALLSDVVRRVRLRGEFYVGGDSRFWGGAAQRHARERFTLQDAPVTSTAQRRDHREVACFHGVALNFLTDGRTLRCAPFDACRPFVSSSLRSREGGGELSSRPPTPLYPLTKPAASRQRAFRRACGGAASQRSRRCGAVLFLSSCRPTFP